MKGNSEILKVLNEVLRKELTGVNQYFLHSKMCRNWGYEVLANVHWKESIDEMKHADRIVERILFLEGAPNVQAYDKIQVGSTVKEQLENDRGLEQAALTILKPGIKPASTLRTTPPGSYSSTLSSMKSTISTGSKLSFTKSRKSAPRTTCRSRYSIRVKFAEQRHE